MITIWGRTNSLNVQKVLWTLEELGLTYDRIDAGLHYGVNDTPAFKVMNPNGLVPVLKDDEFILWESHAILRYLAVRYGRQSLWPASEHVAAHADQWMDWSNSIIWAHLRPVFHNLVRTPADQRDMPAVAAGIAGLGKSFQILDQHLQTQPYVAGEVFSIGDIPLALLVFRWIALVQERPATAALDQWFERVTGRAGFVKHCSAPLT
jgi:glutathione S-transferase